MCDKNNSETYNYIQGYAELSKCIKGTYHILGHTDSVRPNKDVNTINLLKHQGKIPMGCLTDPNKMIRKLNQKNK